MMGEEGLRKATQIAILNANYLKAHLNDYYTIKDVNENGFVGHEFIIDTTEFKKIGLTDVDISKRLMDYSFHPPTMSWPRNSVLMFEPTESESLKAIIFSYQLDLTTPGKSPDIESSLSLILDNPNLR